MLSPAHIALFFSEFVISNLSQIHQKARFFGLEVDEIENELFILIAERLDEFDAARGNAVAFLFGLLHARLARNARDVANFARSLDDGSQDGIAFRAHVEHWAAAQDNTPCFTNTNRQHNLPGASDLESLADAASGQSAHEIGRRLKISRRRVNQIRREKELAAHSQFSFDFSERKNHD
jgi:hypothetical protein